MVFGERDSRTGCRPVTVTYPRETARNRQRIDREWLRLHRRAERLQRDDLKRAFALITDQIWGWWD